VAPPVWTVGQVLASADVNNWFVPVPAYKTALLGRSGTTRTNDPDLSVALASNCAYEVRAMLMFGSTTGGNGFDFGFNTPAGADGSWGVAYNANGVGNVTEGHLFTDAINCGTPAGVNQSCILHGVIYTSGTSGNITVSWAAHVTGGTTNLNKGSCLIAQRIT
jgi:hypothetical protein